MRLPFFLCLPHAFARNKCTYSTFGHVRLGNVSDKLHVPGNIQKPVYWKTGVPDEPPIKPDIKSDEEITKIKKSCLVASEILSSLKDFIKVGVTTDAIDKQVHELCLQHEVYPSPLFYHKYPKSVCTSVNNVACHGIPDDRPLSDGDILNVDITVFKDGYHGDVSAMFLCGNVDDKGIKLCQVAKLALEEAIKVCKPGVPFSSIGLVCEKVALSNSFCIIPAFAGHGIGSYFHGPPDIYHYANTNDEGVMKKGMVFTIEPVLGEGGEEIEVLHDRWTAVTADGSRAAQWEHTVLITESAALPLTFHP